MALRGETIGTAFVRILADGTGFAKSIEGEMDKGKEPMRKAGEEHSKAYKDSFNKEQKKNNKFIKDIQKNLDSAEGIFAARGHVAGEEFQKGISEGVQKILQGTEMEDRAKEIGDKVAQNLSIGLNSNGNLNKDFTANIINAIKDIQKEEAAALKKTRTDQKTAIKDLSNQLDELISRHKALGGAHKKNGDSSKDLVRDFRKLVGEIDNTSGAIDVTRKRVRSLSGDMKSSGTGLRRFFTEMDKVSATTAKIFGKGSRNDFLNLMGTIVGGMTKLPSVAGKGFTGLGKLLGQIPDALGKIPDLAGKAVDGLGQVGDMFSKGSKAAEDLGKQAATGLGEASTMIEGIGATGPAALPIIAGIVVALATAMPLIATFISMVSAAIGGAVAVLGSLAFAAVGALVPLLPLIVPLTVAFAGLALAFAGLSKAQKKALSVSIKPITKEFRDLGAETRKGLFGKNNENIKAIANELAPAIKSLKPMFAGAGKAIADVGLDFSKAINSPGAKSFIDAFTKFVPEAIRKMGAIAKNILGGFGGLFKAAIPFAREFLDWLVKVTKRFSGFANSKKGQEKLGDFFGRAVDSAKQVWGLIKAVGKVLGTLLSSGKDTGDSILKSLTDNVEQFAQFLKDNPKALEDWFKSGKDVFDQIGGIIKNIGKLIDFLDSPDFRKAATGFLFLMKWSIIGVVGVVWLLLQPVENLILAIKLLWQGAKFLWGQMKKLGPVFKDLWGWVKKTWKSIEDLAGTIKDKAVKAWQDLGKAISDLWNDLKALPGNIWKAITDGFKRAIAWVTGTFLPWVQNLPNKIMEFLGSVAGTIFGAIWQGFADAKDWITNTFLPWVATVPGSVADFFKAAPGFIKDWFVGAYNAVKAWVTGTFLPWAKGLPGKVKAYFTGGGTFIKDWFVKAYNSVKSWITGTFLPWARGVPGKIAGAFSSTSNFIKDFFKRSFQRVKDWWTTSAWPWIKGLPSKVVSGFSNLGGSIASGIEAALKGAVNKIIDGLNSFARGFNKHNGPAPDIPLIPHVARGTLLDQATLLVAGESGPEAIVPLDRPLSQVDPAVRALSAIAQGKAFPTQQQPTGKIVNIGGLTVVTPTEDPKAVASEVVNKLVGAAYI